MGLKCPPESTSHIGEDPAEGCQSSGGLPCAGITGMSLKNWKAGGPQEPAICSRARSGRTFFNFPRHRDKSHAHIKGHASKLPERSLLAMRKLSWLRQAQFQLRSGDLVAGNGEGEVASRTNSRESVRLILCHSHYEEQGVGRLEYSYSDLAALKMICLPQIPCIFLSVSVS